MKTSHAGVLFIAGWEATKLTAYVDGGGVWTIGIGHTASAGEPIPRPGLTITRAEANELFARDLVKYEKTVNDTVHVPVTQNEFDAMVSLCFNIGQNAFARKCSVPRLVNQGDKKGAAKAFLLWNRDNGHVVQGLVNRRNAEMRRFLTPDGAIATPAPNVTVTKPGFWVRLIAFLTRK